MLLVVLLAFTLGWAPPAGADNDQCAPPGVQSASALPPDFQGKPSAADLHITPDGRFLYG